VWGADIDVYGELRNLRGAREACPFRWPGQYEDAETGLYYNRFRYYDAQSGEYTSQDRVGLIGGTALYAYVRDPLRECDFTGLAPASLLPGEGDVGSYGDLRRGGRTGDNVTPHHIPSDRYMSERVPGYTRNEGIAMNMEQPTPGTGGRHRRTASYGSPPDLSLTPRQALARDIMDARRIYQADGLYDSRMRQALAEVIAQNKAKWPHAFERPATRCP
jgi:RHS repeat-associated protein